MLKLVWLLVAHHATALQLLHVLALQLHAVIHALARHVLLQNLVVIVATLAVIHAVITVAAVAVVVEKNVVGGSSGKTKIVATNVIAATDVTIVAIVVIKTTFLKFNILDVV